MSDEIDEYSDIELDEESWKRMGEEADQLGPLDDPLEEPPGPGDLEHGSEAYIRNYRARLIWETRKRTKHTPREWQLQAALAVHLGRDVFVHAGTGSGKTLPFVMNCFLDPKLRVWLVSPLNALGNQQAKTFKDWKLGAVAVNSTTNYKGLYKDIKNGKYQVIISSIEAFLDTTRLFPAVLSPELASLGDQLLVLDEAHCMDSWGKGFRPQYRKIGDLKAVLTNKVPFMAVAATANATATARRTSLTRCTNSRVLFMAVTVTATTTARAGIPKALHFGSDALEINLGNHRKNLAYSVHKLKSVTDCAQEVLHYFPSKTELNGYSLIFVNSRPIGTQVLTVLRGHFIPELHGRIELYHSSRSELDKQILAAGFEKADGFGIMVTSDALTMGLDFRKVSLVIQLKSPEDLPTTLQRLGRGGRDENMVCEAVLMAEESPFEDTKLGQRRMKERVEREENKPVNPQNGANKAPDARVEVSDAMLRFINTSGCRVQVQFGNLVQCKYPRGRWGRDSSNCYSL
ncbi:hypothetical protein RSAG8_12374, partial [Rhizoctonia solani AG-8 WAC10335]